MNGKHQNDYPKCAMNETETFRCCIYDGGRSSEVRLQGLASNRLMRLHLKEVVVSD